MRTQLQIGAQGASIVKRLLIQNGNIITKLSRPHYKITIGQNYIWIFTEKESSRNISLEWWDDKPRKKGWFQKLLTAKSKPEFIFFVCLNEGAKIPKPTVTVLKTLELIAYMREHLEECDKKHVHLSLQGLQPNLTEVLLVPIRVLNEVGVIQRIYRQNEGRFDVVIIPVPEREDTLEGLFEDFSLREVSKGLEKCLSHPELVNQPTSF